MHQFCVHTPVIHLLYHCGVHHGEFHLDFFESGCFLGVVCLEDVLVGSGSSVVLISEFPSSVGFFGPLTFAVLVGQLRELVTVIVPNVTALRLLLHESHRNTCSELFVALCKSFELCALQIVKEFVHYLAVVGAISLVRSDAHICQSLLLVYDKFKENQFA